MNGLVATGDARHLFELDEAEDAARLAGHPVWRAVDSGEASSEQVAAIVLALYPVFTGRARYLLASKVAWLELDDGKLVFADLHRVLTDADADADAGWRRVATALGIGADELEAAGRRPDAVASDLVTIAREHGHRSAHEGVGVTFVLERSVPRMLGQLAEALRSHYGLGVGEVAHLGHRAMEASATAARLDELVGRYLREPFQVYEARRAAREVIWDLIALLEQAAGS
jgi:pyrroloquinoline quinone (PQQ) biosynthesis protein C